MASNYSPVVTSTEDRERFIITKEHARLMNKAEVVSFHFHDEGAYMRLSSRNWAGDGGKMKWEVEIPCLNTVEVFGRDAGRVHEHPFNTAYASFLSARFEPSWITIASLIKAGDVLEFHWIVGNNSETLDEHGLVRDELEMFVYRDNNHFKRLTFNVDVYVGKDNSARMVRRGPLNVASAVEAR